MCLVSVKGLLDKIHSVEPKMTSDMHILCIYGMLYKPKRQKISGLHKTLFFFDFFSHFLFYFSGTVAH